MRFLFKTRYEQDIRLFKHGGQAFWYATLGVASLLAPWIFSDYFVSQLVFIWIYSIVGLGLMLLVGYTGQVSTGTRRSSPWAPTPRPICSSTAGRSCSR